MEPSAQLKIVPDQRLGKEPRKIIEHGYASTTTPLSNGLERELELYQTALLVERWKASTQTYGIRSTRTGAAGTSSQLAVIVKRRWR